MGRHRTPDEKRELAQQARLLREQGVSRREILAQLHVGDDLAAELLRGVPVPDSLRRSRAKDDLREVARELRRAGRTYAEISHELGVSRSSCSLWLRDLPRGGDAVRRERTRRSPWDRLLVEREAERCAVKGDEAARIGAVTLRELELLAVTAYWCEGQKDKVYARRETVKFVNSDPGLIRLFVAYLDAVRFPLPQRRFSLSIHESADLAAARDYWAGVVGVPPESFLAPSLKRHNPATPRKNTGPGYVGCLVVRLVQCRTMYQRIEGVWQGIMEGLVATPQEGSTGNPSRVV